MLAERRSKVKWTLNPRGNFWAQDETSYGQRMLRKMGWEKGKGLGKNEDGNTEHIKVTYKNDTKGIGAKGYDDEWIAHQDDFNSVLSSLNEQFTYSMQTDSKEPVIESLEKKSKSSRSRVHYHKFIRGKDLTTYSSRDIAAIFGKKTKENDESNEEGSISEENMKESAETTTIITYNSGQNIQDYFKQKMAALRYNKTAGNQNNIPSREDDSLALSKDVTNSNPEFPTDVNVVEENQENTVMKKRKRHKNKKMDIDAEFSQKDSFAEDSQSKLNKKSKQQFTNNDTCENSFDSSVTPEICRNGVTETLMQDTLESKKSESLISCTIGFTPSKKTEGNILEQFTESSEWVESVLRKSKKKRKIDAVPNQSFKQGSSDSGIWDSDSVNTHSNYSTNKEIPKREGCLVEDLISSGEMAGGTSTKKVKKSKKNKREKIECIYPNLNLHNLKTVRYNALQQMKLYFDVFPNRQTLSLLKKYEEVCVNFNTSGLASSNLLSIHGYGNEFLLKDHSL